MTSNGATGWGECQPLSKVPSSLSASYLPLKDEVEPVSNNSNPEEFDAHSFSKMKPDREENIIGIPEVREHRYQDEPILSVLVVHLQVVC